MSSLEITIASQDDVRLMAQWAADEGWNPGLNDRLAFTSADPRGFLIGCVGGQPAACISVVRYGTDHGFLGFYIAREPFRGKGLGLRIWHAGMSRMGARNVGLDGVVDQQPNYRKSGFAAAWTNVRFTGAPGGRTPRPRGCASSMPARSPSTWLARYDRRFFPAPRDSFLSCWLATPDDRIALAALRDGNLVGFGVCRPAQTHSRVGPLYAEIAADRRVRPEWTVRAGRARRWCSTCPTPTRRPSNSRRSKGLSPISRRPACTPGRSRRSTSTATSPSPPWSWADGGRDDHRWRGTS